MILKKSKLTYFSWVLFIILGFGSLYLTANKNSYLLSQLPVDEFVAGITLFALLLVIAEILTVCSKFVVKLSKGKEPEVGGFIETIILFFVLVATFMSRFIYITSINGVPTDGISLLNLSSYGDNFKVSPIMYLYWALIHPFTGLLSTPAVSAMYVNVFIQLIIIVLLYFSIRKMMGLIPAIVSTVFYAFLPCSIIAVGVIDADFLYALMMVLALFTMVIPKWLALNGKISHGIRLFLLVLAGFIAGFLLATDKTAVGLLLFACFSYSLYKNESSFSVNESKGEILLYIIGSIVGFVIALCIFDSFYGFGMFGYFNMWVNDFNSIKLNTNIIIPGNGNLYVLIPMVLMVVWSFRIFKIERDHGSIIVIIPFMMALCSLLSIGTCVVKTDIACLYSSTYMIFWAILGAMGFASIGKNSLAYLEEEKEAKQKDEQRRLQALEAAKKELEEKKARLAELNKKKKEINIGTTAMTDTQNLKELEAQLDFLKKDNEVKNNEELDSNLNSTDESNNIIVETSDDKAEAESGEIVSIDKEKNVDESNKVETDDSNETSVSVNNNSVVLPEKQADNKIDLKAKPLPKEEKPRYVSMSSPSSKFARRMDYRTAIVKSNQTEEAAKASDTKDTSENETNIKTEAQTVNEASTTVETPVESVSTHVSYEAIDSNVVVDSDSNDVQEEKEEVLKAILEFEKKDSDASGEGDNRPDLMSVNLIESREGLQESMAEEPVKEVDNNSDKPVIIDDNVLDLSKLDKHENAEEPVPAPEVNPVSAQEPVLKSVVAKKPPIMGKETEPVNKIHNPLPTPKKHTTRELDYDVEPLQADLHFDIVDLTGKDFFDIN